MRHYIPSWEAIGIKKERYLELLHFCRQYPDWKTEVASLVGPFGVKLDGMPHGSTPGDPVASAAERRERLIAKIDLVDRCAAAVDRGRWYAAIIQNVCMMRPYASIAPSVLPTSDRNSFFKARKAFFILLNKSKGGEDDNHI